MITIGERFKCAVSIFIYGSITLTLVQLPFILFGWMELSVAGIFSVATAFAFAVYNFFSIN